MVEVATLAVSVTLQLIAAVLALRLIRVTGRTLAWVAIASAVLLMAVRRGSTLIAALQLPAAESGVTLSTELIALAISALLVCGLASIGPMFERIRRAEELEEGFGRVIESSLHEIYVFGADDLRFLRVSRGARSNLGFSEAELFQLTPVDIKPEFDEPGFRAVLAPLQAGGDTRAHFPSRHRRKDGSTYPVDVDLQPTRFDGRDCYLAVIRDTSQREAAERSLRESEEHFRSLIEHSQDLTSVVDWGGRIVYQSPSIRAILGWDPADRVGKPALDLIHGDDRGMVQRALDLAGAGVLPDAPLVYRLQHADGRWRTMEGVGSIRVLPNGEKQVVINQRDITDRQLAIERQLHAESLLQHAQRMETIGTFAGGIAHDFNNLLSPIVGYAEMLGEGLAGRPEAQADLAEILAAAGRAKGLVQQLLVFSRRAEPRFEAVRVEEVVHDAMGLVRVAAPQSVELHVDLDASGETVLADAIQLHQVVMNLCTNAIHAMRSEGGELRVSLSRATVCPERPGDPGSARAGAFVRLTVADTGHGMDDVTRARLFEPFFTTKLPGEGTGLGLAVVHGIVLKHQGVISFSSTPGSGTTFDVYLPALGVAAVATAVPAPTRLSGSERVLVVDDDAAVARVLQRLLERHGYAVEIARDPAAALERVARDDSVELVITDYDMPQMNGLDLAERIRDLRPGLPVVLVTGLGDAATNERSAQVGIAARVTKPFTGPHIVGLVRAALDARERA